MILPGRLYATGAPVMIVSARVLSDEETGSSRLSLMLKNVSGTPIVSLFLRALLLNDANEIISTQDIQYTMLNVPDNANFGDDVSHSLPIDEFSNITFQLLNVSFADGLPWNGSSYMIECVPDQEPIATKLNDSRLYQLYRTMFGQQATMVYASYGDLWLCTCGAIHKTELPHCGQCGASKSLLDNFTVKELKDRLDAMGGEVPPNPQEEVYKSYEVSKKEDAYRKAIHLIHEESDYDSLHEALDLLEPLGGYKESKLLRTECRERLAGMVDEKMESENNRSFTRITIIVSIVLVLLAAGVIYITNMHQKGEKYQTATTYFQHEDYRSAASLFKELGSYKNSEQMAAQSEYLSTFTESEYFRIAEKYVERVKELGWDAYISHDIDHQYGDSWGARVTIRVTMKFRSEAEYNDAYPYSTDQRKMKSEWKVFFNEFNAEMMAYYDKELARIDTPRANWQISVFVEYPKNSITRSEKVVECQDGSRGYTESE